MQVTLAVIAIGLNSGGHRYGASIDQRDIMHVCYFDNNMLIDFVCIYVLIINVVNVIYSGWGGAATRLDAVGRGASGRGNWARAFACWAVLPAAAWGSGARLMQCRPAPGAMGVWGGGRGASRSAGR